MRLSLAAQKELAERGDSGRKQSMQFTPEDLELFKASRFQQLDWSVPRIRLMPTGVAHPDEVVCLPACPQLQGLRQGHQGAIARYSACVGDQAGGDRAARRQAAPDLIRAGPC